MRSTGKDISDKTWFTMLGALAMTLSPIILVVIAFGLGFGSPRNSGTFFSHMCDSVFLLWRFIPVLLAPSAYVYMTFSKVYPSKVASRWAVAHAVLVMIAFLWIGGKG